MRLFFLILALAALAVAGVERAIVDATNAQRAALGLRRLKSDPRLDEAALRHSEDMLRRSKLSHDSPLKGLETPALRASAAGVNWRKVAENVSFYRGYRPPAAEVVRDWMNSPHHRVNIVDPEFRLIGLGTACRESRCYVTQMFAVERNPLD